MAKNWYDKVLIQYKKESVSTAIFFLVFALAVLLWRFAFGRSFEWVEISPVPTPDIWSRAILSALTYKTIGRYLYKIYFYKILAIIFGEILHKWKWYRDIKDVVWNILMFVMFFFIIPFVVDLLNKTISFFYNIVSLILYFAPPLGITLILYLCYILYKKRSDSSVISNVKSPEDAALDA